MLSLFLGLIVITSPMPPEPMTKTYYCKECDFPLFNHSESYDAGTEWMTFSDPIDSKHVYQTDDDDVLCSQCGDTLGHLFLDGPLPNSTRYSINPIKIK
jgi:peptide-methionine (R)-S-oxide reductase